MDVLGAPSLDNILAGVKAGDGKELQIAAKTGDTEGLRHAAREFESVFLNQLLKSMRSTVPENELFNGGGATKFYQQLHDAELARSLAGGNGSIGLANLIERQLSPDVAVDTAASSGPIALSRYQVYGEAADGPRRRAEIESLSLRAVPAERDTLHHWRNDLQTASERHEVPCALLLAVVMEESGGDEGAVSEKGARGLMQLMPATAREMGVEDPAVGGANIAGGAKYLKQQLERFDGRLDLALAAYNAGPGSVEQAGRVVPEYPETLRYVARVTARYQRLIGGTELAKEAR